MSPKRAEDHPLKHTPPGRGSIPPSVARRLAARAAAIAEAVTRPRGKPWDGVTYGRREEVTPKMKADRAKAIREHDAKRAEADAQE